MGKQFRRLSDSVAASKQTHRRGFRGVHSMAIATSSYLLELGHFVLQHANEDLDTTPLVEAHRDFEAAVKEFLG